MAENHTSEPKATQDENAGKADHELEVHVGYVLKVPAKLTHDEAVSFIKGELAFRSSRKEIVAYTPLGEITIVSATIASAQIAAGAPEMAKEKLQPGVKPELQAARTPEMKDALDEVGYEAGEGVVPSQPGEGVSEHTGKPYGQD